MKFIFMDRKKVGKQKRAEGKDFEKRVHKELLHDEWTVCRWNNTVDLDNNKLKEVRPKFINGRIMMMTGGFPDYACWSLDGECWPVGVECKLAGELDHNEKVMCEWLLKNNIFHKIYIASKHKEKNRIKIRYEDFRIKYADWLLKNG